MPTHPPEHDPMDFAKRLKEAMADVGQNTGHGAGSDLARRYKISAVSANAWLNGSNLPTPERARALANNLGVRFEWLYFGQPPKSAVADVHGVYEITSSLTPEELALLRGYRAANDALRAIVDNVLVPKPKGTKPHRTR